MSKVEIRWHGRGGQGVVTANEILAAAALKEGKYIKAFPEFGPERMGAPIRAFARISDEPINNHSQVYYPNYVIVLDPSLLGNPMVKEGLSERSELVANYPDTREKLRAMFGNYNVHAVNATRISMEEIGRPMANTAMLGAFIKVSKIVDINTITSELAVKLSGKLKKDMIDKNIGAVVRAYEEVE